jgi:two-component system response regulator PilR (NtrC family)
VSHRVLIVDDERSMRELLEIWFLQRGAEVDVAADGAAAIVRIDQHSYDLIITDMRMPKSSGMEVLAHARKTLPETPVIIMTAFASTETAVSAMKLGALDYFTKPFKLDAVAVVVDKALAQRALIVENRRLREELANRTRVGNLIGRSDAMRQVFDLIRRMARTPANVLVLGESGTGKELVARAIHHEGPRADGPFRVINCGAIPEALIESELFGHRKGAFTGANADHDGLFKAASGGTLFLDEIGELPLAMQVKLLRVLQEKRVRAVGAVEELPIDVRIIAATNRDLATEAKAGRFREDLFYRLNVLSIDLPPLRARPSDIPLLANHFLTKYATEFAKPVTAIEPSAMRRLLAWPFGGNVRELENVIERAVALVDGAEITQADLPPALRKALPSAAAPAPEDEFPENGVDLDGAVETLERRLISAALTRTGGQKKAAARLLGISFRSLRYRLTKLGLSGPNDA